MLSHYGSTEKHSPSRLEHLHGTHNTYPKALKISRSGAFHSDVILNAKHPRPSLTLSIKYPSSRMLLQHY